MILTHKFSLWVVDYKCCNLHPDTLREWNSKEVDLFCVKELEKVERKVSRLVRAKAAKEMWERKRIIDVQTIKPNLESQCAKKTLKKRLIQRKYSKKLQQSKIEEIFNKKAKVDNTNFQKKKMLLL